MEKCDTDVCIECNHSKCDSCYRNMNFKRSKKYLKLLDENKVI